MILVDKESKLYLYGNVHIMSYDSYSAPITRTDQGFYMTSRMFVCSDLQYCHIVSIASEQNTHTSWKENSFLPLLSILLYRVLD